jgi:CheY-like chemotaxis protein
MNSKTILFVEDNEDTRRIYSEFFRHHGYEVLEAANGQEGVQLARQLRPDIVVMNLSMPVIDGLSATSLIRENEATAGIPIVVCTAFVREDGSDLAFAAGCDAYLEKPAEPSRVLEEVERLVGRKMPAILE